MYIDNDEIVYSPSDLTLYMDSPFASAMEHAILLHPDLTEKVDAQDPLLSVLQNRGILYEQDILKQFQEEGLQVICISRSQNAFQDTIAAMQQGADVIYQAALSTPPFRGYADFLVKIKGISKWGDYQYEPWDIKLSKNVKPQFLVQLCCYAEMLETTQGHRPEQLTVVINDGERVQLKTRDYFYYYQQLKTRFLILHQNFSEEKIPSPSESDSYGRWSSYAKQLLVEMDHLSQTATITKSQIKKLNHAGIKTMQSLVDTNLKHIKGIHNDTFNRLKAQAKIQKASKGKFIPLYEILPHEPLKKVGLAMLPPSSPNDIYFDIEGFPLEKGGLEYLWGVSFLNDQGIREYKDFWAHSQEQEKCAFKEFIEWVYNRWQNDPSMHIYHYANYEIAACRKLMGRYGICEDMVDALLRNEVFVDLYKIVKHSILLGEPRYSIKNVEHLYREKRETEVGSGSDSVVVYERWRELPDGDTWESSSILKSIRDYNIDDCYSTQELVTWLRQRQQEQGIEYLGKTEVIEIQENEKLTNLIQLRDRLLNKAEQLNTQGLIKERDVTNLFAWCLEFHRREKKPMYWRLFDRMDSSDEELIDDIDCLALCTRTDKPPYKPSPRAKNLAYEYRFDPNQEFKAASENYLVLGQNRDDGKNISVKMIKDDSSLPEGLIVLQSGTQLENIISLMPDENINAEPIPSAILSMAQAYDQGKLSHTAIEDFLFQKPPRIKGKQKGVPIVSSQAPEMRLEEIIHAIKQLDNSYLTIQGPPGSGKTYTAKHVIAELLKLGKRIGISSNSHKAINHLLMNTAKYCHDNNIPAYFACTKETDEEILKFDIQVLENNAISRHLKSSCLIGTTAWGFARTDLEQQFDYLFIDEAGQVSVANLIAMSRATKNIVLMGDQMQLGQPSQGSHPEESGLSILDYLLHETPTIPENMGVFLGTTYRMHSAVNSFISEAIYEGKLSSHVHNDFQRILVPENYSGDLNKEHGIISIFVSHEGNTQASDEEVERIHQLANELLGRIFVDKQGKSCQITWDDMLFVAPYNHQVNKLRQVLGKDAKVGSVDKFQGQEAPIVFLSMCASNANESPRGMDFLFDRNRINVAVSRAQCLTIVVCSPILTDVITTNLHQIEKVNLFCNLLHHNC